MTITGPDGLQRIPPALPASAMQTYQVLAPLSTHFRPATCAEAECPAYLNGWETVVPADSPAAEYIRHDRSRRHVEERTPEGLARFTFEPGQQGFAGRDHDHRLPTGRPERFFVRGGDWRSTGERREMKAEDWTDKFANNLSSLKEQIEKG